MDELPGVDEVDWNVVVPAAARVLTARLRRLAGEQPEVAASVAVLLREAAEALEGGEGREADAAAVEGPEVGVGEVAAAEAGPGEDDRRDLDRWARQLRQKAVATRWQIERLELLADPARRGTVQPRDAEIAGSCQGLWMCSPAYNQTLVAEPAVAESLVKAYRALADELAECAAVIGDDEALARRVGEAETARRAVERAARGADYDRPDAEQQQAGRWLARQADRLGTPL